MDLAEASDCEQVGLFRGGERSSALRRLRLRLVQGGGYWSRVAEAGPGVELPGVPAGAAQHG